MSRPTTLLILATTLCLACQPSTRAPVWTLEPSADPITITLGLADGRATSVEVPLDGGVLTATGDDGTTYTLEVPATALLEPTRITMTPVSSSANVPMGDGSLAFGVQLEPSGLTLYAPATLTITPPSGQQLAVSSQLFVDWEGRGERLGLALPDRASSALRAHVLHFSGVGVVRSKGLDADIEPVRQRIGGTAERRIQSAVAEAIHRARRDQTLAFLENGLLEQYMQEVVRPRVAAAGSSCAAGRLAIITVLGLDRQLQLLGGDQSVSTLDFGQLVPVVAEVCMKEEFEICRDEHVLTRVLPALLGIERQGQLLGVTDTSAPYEKFVKACLRFELDLRSSASVRGSSFDLEETMKTMRLRIEMTGRALELTITGEGAWISEAYTPTIKGCGTPVNVMRVGSQFTVERLGFVPNGEDVSDFALDFRFTPNMSSFDVRDCSSPPRTAGPNVMNHFILWTAVANAPYPGPGQASYRVEGFSTQRAVTLGTRNVTHTESTGRGSITIADTWDLRHAPDSP